MRVIGKADYGIYICEVKHSELEKFLNTYYGKMETLGVGEEIDLGKGYDFLKQTKDCFRKTTEFIKSSHNIIETILTGIKLSERDAEIKEDNDDQV